MSNFGKAQLLKYGWTEGRGLGKDENGIAEPLKPKLKFDTSGIGHKDSNFQWWSSIYDKALKNVVSDNSTEKVSINVIKENAFNISSTENGLEVSEKKQRLHYGKFLKTSTLKDGSIIREKTCAVIEDNDEKEHLSFTQISDEELFKACGGRTAHKGARHGLKLSGKLARIAEQEKKLLADQFLKSSEIPLDSSKKSKKAKKRKIGMDVEDCTLDTPTKNVSDNEDDVILPIPSNIQNNYKLSKKSVKKLKQKVSDLSHQLSKSSLVGSNEQSTDNVELLETFSDKPSKKSVKKLKRKVNELSNQLSKSCLLEETTTEDHGSNVDEYEKQSEKVKKKSKKKKHKRKLDENDFDSGIDNIQLNVDATEPCTKKSKKQCKESSELEDLHEENTGTETDKECGSSKYSYSTWRNAKIKSKKLKKREKKKKINTHSNLS